jgi:hypothetical protein
VLPAVLSDIKGACLFWLDGHYSYGKTARGTTDTPILAELAHIFRRANPNDVILIDDARLFTGGVYPPLRRLNSVLRAGRVGAVVEVQHDIIRCFPKPPSSAY